MTIGAKLGFGFSGVIALLAISAGVAYYNISLMRANVSEVLDEAVPTVRSCQRLLDSLNQASAALRGYLAIGVDVKKAENFHANNASAWDDAEAELERMFKSTFVTDSPQVREQVDTLARLARKQSEYHQQIIQAASADDNVPARFLFQTQLAPKVDEAIEAAGGAIDEEVSQAPSVERRRLFKALADFRGSLALSLADLRAYLSAGDEPSKETFHRDWRSSAAAYQTVLEMAHLLTPGQKPYWDRVAASRESIERLPGEVIRLRDADNWNRAEYVWLAQSTPLRLEIRDVLEQITAAAEVRERTERQQLEAAGRRTVAALSAATIIGIIVGSVIAVALSRNMATTVRALAERAQQISEGDLSGSAIASKGADELATLAGGFNVMLANLRDLTTQILSVTKNVNSAASQISSSAKQQATSTQEQVATVQEITSTMQEISQSGAQIVAKAKEVAAVAEQASASSKSGMEAVQGTNRTMEAIREQVEEVAENIVALSEKTQAVGEIISTVNEIAEQSNLLALNATIEAAEAGEDGSRFSVVAAEMKNLADQAKECTVHVRKILGEIQKSINTSVMLTEEAVKRVEKGKQQADVSEEVICQISSTTEDSIQAFQQIIGATNQQQIGFEQVARGMQDIDQATQQTATGTAQLEQAVVSLSALSTQLQSAVASYKV